MAYQIINSTVITASHAISLGAIDSVFVGAAGFAASTSGGNGVFGTGSNQTVRVEGTVVGMAGISMGDSTVDTGARIWIGAGGLVSGTGNGVISTNSGTLISNFGTIEGANGIVLTGNGLGFSKVSNAGLIYGTVNAINASGTEAISIYNTGTIWGENLSIVTSGLSDVVRNRGDIVGTVELLGGNDLYDGRGGAVDGAVNGGEGNDSFRMGVGIEVIDGGNGIDTLDFRSGPGIKVALDESFINSGAAAGDTYTNIESIMGSRVGADVLTGNLLANILNGYGGKDKLSGGLGNDSIGGGLGVDTLSGGLGDDVFYFNTLGDGGDQITDFGNVLDDNDSFVISSAAFGGGLAGGALSASQFQTRTDNNAQDGDDRFIYDTSTFKLWFDANGNLSGGLTLLATLDATAVVVAGDFLIN